MPAHHAKTRLLVVANARHSPSYGCALRLDQACFDAPLGHARKLSRSEADIELMKVEQLGNLAMAIFERVASTDSDARGIFSSEAAADYTKAIGREVRVEEIQPIMNDLLAANLIMRRGHGMYGVTDPFVQEIWREKKALENKA
jgi:hypothetical protein